MQIYRGKHDINSFELYFVPLQCHLTSLHTGSSSKLFTTSIRMCMQSIPYVYLWGTLGVSDLGQVELVSKCCANYPVDGCNICFHPLEPHSCTLNVIHKFNYEGTAGTEGL